MGEFVEQSLEVLIPVLEQLGNIQLLSSEELSTFIKRCRRYEYRLQKKGKTPEDFLLYADYLIDVVALIKSRRKRMNYFHKYKLIDFEILRKITSLLRRCCDRYAGRYDIWQKFITFLREHKLNKDLSKAYTRFLQYHNKDVELYGEAALFELCLNASIENARVLLQLALRGNAKEPRLYTHLFNVEVLFVERIIARQNFLKKGVPTTSEKNDIEEEAPELDTTDISDAILDLKVAEVVLRNALRNVEIEKQGDMLIDMFKILNGVKLANSESVGRLQKLIEDSINGLSQESIQSFLVGKALLNNESAYDVYENAIVLCCTEEMHRKYLKFCQNQSNDPIATSKISAILGKLIEHDWASQEDFEMASNNFNSLLQQADRDVILNQCIKHYPSSSIFWVRFIESKIEGITNFTKENISDVLQLFNTALEKVSIDDCYSIWEHLIDFAMSHTPENIEKIFDRAYLVGSPVVSSRVKVLRAKYLDALVSEKKLSQAERNRELLKLVKQKPNTPEFYLALYNGNVNCSSGDIELVKAALDAAVIEYGKSSIDSWISYINFAMHHDVSQVSKLYQRAMVSLDKDLCSDFITEWTKVNHSEASEQIKKAQEVRLEDTTGNEPAMKKKKQ